MKKNKKKKKKQLLKKNVLNHFEKILQLQQLFINNDNTDFYMFIRMYSFIKHFNKIALTIRKRENIDYIVPSTFICYQKDITIKPFWNEHIQQLSDELFLPINENIIKVNNFTNIFKKTWFDTEFFESKNENNIEFPINKNDVTKKQIKTKSIKLYPNSIQKRILKKFIGTYRYYYNRTIQYINNYDKKNRCSYYYVNHLDVSTKIDVDIPKTKTYDRDEVTDTVYFNPYKMEHIRPILKMNPPEWLDKQYPSHLIDQAINEALNAFSNNMKKYNKTGNVFKLKFKNTKNVYQTIKIDSVYFSKNKNTFFGSYKINDIKVFDHIKSSESFNVYGQKMSNLTWNKVTNKWTLHIPIDDIPVKINKKYKIGSIDPGMRHYCALYSTDHVCLIGKDVTTKIMKICKEIDIINSRLNRDVYYVKKNDEIIYYTVNSKRRKSLRKALHLKIQYLKNLKNELHYKTIIYLCKNYEKIIYPRFEIQKMSGKLSSKIARNMYNLSYHQFARRLMETSIRYNTEILNRGEAYTTKTCTRCGEINNNVGCNIIFICNKCGLRIGRDFNGARNILLKNNEYI